MNVQEAILYFGSKTAVASACGVTLQAVSQWGEYPPVDRQFMLEVETGGDLKAESANEFVARSG